MELNEKIVNRLKSPIYQTWDTIGPDALGAFPDADNKEALELCIDANRIEFVAEDVEASALISNLIKEHGYKKVLNFLNKNIKIN